MKPAPFSFDNPTFPELAAWFVQYFQARVRYAPTERYWQEGLDTAQQWNTLIYLSNLSQAEMVSFIAGIVPYYERTHMWFAMTHHISEWSVSRGFPALFTNEGKLNDWTRLP